MRIVKAVGLGSVVLFVACGPGVAGFSGAIAGVVTFAGMFALAGLAGRRDARAGAPMPCDGYEELSCNGTTLVKRCCPKGAKCNFRDGGPYVDCGHGLCRSGGDLGRCLSPAPITTASKTEDACKTEHGSWALVCAEKVVAGGCLPPMPTNFSGPGYNPLFIMCGKGDRLVSEPGPVVGERCTTHRLREDCYPSLAELGGKCLGVATKVCLGGKVIEKCLPVSGPLLQPSSWAAADYVTCDDGSCAVGTSKAYACRF